VKVGRGVYVACDVNVACGVNVGTGVAVFTGVSVAFGVAVGARSNPAAIAGITIIAIKTRTVNTNHVFFIVISPY
jgi:hypothetical protein